MSTAFQELAKDIHESNKNISNPYEQHDAEQYNWAFDSLLSEEKKNIKFSDGPGGQGSF
jgi:hypothetical protein